MASMGTAVRSDGRRGHRRHRRHRRVRFQAASFDATPVPTTRERHLLSRMGCGWSEAAYADLRAAGDENAWFEQQLDPESVPESDVALAVADWFPRLQDSPAQIKANDANLTHRTWQYGRDLGNATLLRRIYSRRSVLES